MKKWKMVSAVLLLVFPFYREVQAAQQSKKIETVVKADTVKEKKDEVKKPTAYEKL